MQNKQKLVALEAKLKATAGHMLCIPAVYCSTITLRLVAKTYPLMERQLTLQKYCAQKST